MSPGEKRDVQRGIQVNTTAGRVAPSSLLLNYVSLVSFSSPISLSFSSALVFHILLGKLYTALFFISSSGWIFIFFYHQGGFLLRYTNRPYLCNLPPPTPTPWARRHNKLTSKFHARMNV